MSNIALDALKQEIEGPVLAQESMKNHTTWKVGGNAEILVLPKDKKDITRAIMIANKYLQDYLVIGNGSNVLVKDNGIKGIVIKLGNSLSHVKLEGKAISAEAGVSLPKLARKACDYGFKGMEFAVGIPASLGGALLMNAGAHGYQIGELVERVEVIDREGKIKHLNKNQLKFSYRQSNLCDMVVTEATFLLEKGDKGLIKTKMEEMLRKRKASQPLNFPNAGSVFKNPEGDYAGRLIEALGLKGMTIGGAEISSKHANFITNTGGATAKDILSLINLVKERVLKEFEIELELEVMVLGED
ncbi:UDP-N-acetylmuramate dehydrogenase [Desulfitispora alkaliphila]|uniref:UDP-N-acetylmuramate dehydrogenase n=1 Tax=Desulfitispora alkaliphila TaxID=622674 RepID=UPI003D1E0DD3